MKDAAWESCAGPRQPPPECPLDQPDRLNLTLSVSNLDGRCELRHAENPPQGECGLPPTYHSRQQATHPRGTPWRLDLKDGALWYWWCNRRGRHDEEEFPEEERVPAECRASPSLLVWVWPRKAATGPPGISPLRSLVRYFSIEEETRDFLKHLVGRPSE